MYRLVRGLGKSESMVSSRFSMFVSEDASARLDRSRTERVVKRILVGSMV